MTARPSFIHRLARRAAGTRTAFPSLPVLVVAALFGAMLLAGARPAASETVPLSSKLVPSTGALFGIYGSARAGRTPQQEVLYLESLAGRTFDLDRMYHRWDKAFPTTYDAQAVSRGRIPALSWASVTQAGVKVPWTDIAAGKHDAWIAARADAVRVFGHKVLLAFQLEPEDDTGFGTPADYRAAWRRIVSIFRERGATNAVFVWNMMAYTFQSGSGRNPFDWYPGDDVIDWLAADGYNWYGSTHVQNGNAPWRSFAAIFQAFYDWGKNRGKPLAVYETGVLDDTKTPDPLRKAQWFKDAAATVKNWPQMKAVIYFNAHGWYFDSSTPAIAGYKAWGADSYFNPLTAPPADTTKPTASVTAPANGATVSGTVSVAAAASDNVGVTKVEFLVDGVVRATDTAAPYDFSWDTTGLANGAAILAARATDAAGNVGSSASLTVTVDNADKLAPSVSLTSPSNGATVSGITSLTAEASDNVGVSRVEFVANGALLASDNSAPYSVSWNTTDFADGPAAVTARAFDAAGNAASSDVAVTVGNGDTVAPFAAITSPTAGAGLSGTVTVTANAEDSVGVTSVELLVDGLVVATSAAAPYSFQLDTTAFADGSRTLVVRALDAAGNAGASAPVVVTIANDDTTLPSVQVTKPLNGAIVVRGKVVQITATASDDRAVVRVEIWVNGTRRCTVKVAPYTCNWAVWSKSGTKNTIRATAYDAAGNSRSSIVRVTTK